MSSRQAPLSFDSFNSTQTLLGSSAYRYHDFAPPIRNKSPLNDNKHESAVKNKPKLMYLDSKYEIFEILPFIFMLSNFNQTCCIPQVR